MTLKDAAAEIRSRYKDFYPADKTGGIICPLCGNGSGADGTGLHLIKATACLGGYYRLHCFRCGVTGSVIDFWMMTAGLDPANRGDLQTAVAAMAAQIGLTVDDAAQVESPGHKPGPPVQPVCNQQTRPDPAAVAPAADYSEYYAECGGMLYNSLQAKAYLNSRGIGEYISIAAGLTLPIGYDPFADPAARPGLIGAGYRPHPCKRIIIPSSRGHYVGRSIQADTPAGLVKLNCKGGKPGIFNGRSLWTAEKVAVCEGAFSAMSFCEIGIPGVSACALNSTAQAGLFISGLERKRPAALIMLCLDNDKAGRECHKVISGQLDRLKIPCIDATAANCGYKDANDAIVNDRQRFERTVKSL